MTRCRWKTSLLITFLVATFGGIQNGASITGISLWNPGGPWLVNSRSTFFRTANDPNTYAPQFIRLADLSFNDATRPLTIEVYGDYRPNIATGDTRNVLHGVFTKTPTILAANLQNRLPDAVSANAPVITGPTYHQSLPTDIAEDFRIVPDANGKFQIKIPAGAEWVAVCVADSYYGDNDDPDRDFQVVFSRW